MSALGTTVIDGLEVEVTPKILDRWIEAMPERARRVLAGGPDEEGWTCTVCVALRMQPDADWNNEMWEWHGSRATSSMTGVERYLRCVLAYVWAGWEPCVEPQGPAVVELVERDAPPRLPPARPSRFLDLLVERGLVCGDRGAGVYWVTFGP